MLVVQVQVVAFGLFIALRLTAGAALPIGTRERLRLQVGRDNVMDAVDFAHEG